MEVEHQVSAGDKKTKATTIQITEEFITNQKIPLVLNLSSLQPDTGFTQPKLKLKFSSEKKQIISKEWTQNLVLEGTKQTPLFSYTDRNNKEKPFKEPFIQDKDIYDNMPIKVSSPINIPKNLEIRMEATVLSWFTGNHNKTFSPTLTAPSNSVGAQPSKEGLKVTNKENYTIASQLFYRFKGTQNWSPTQTFLNYYNFFDNDKIKIQVNQFFFKKGEKLTVTLTLPTGYTKDKMEGLIFSINNNNCYIVLPTGRGQETDPVCPGKGYIEKFDYESMDKDLNEKENYTLVVDWKDNLRIPLNFKISIRTTLASRLGDNDYYFGIKLDTTN